MTNVGYNLGSAYGNVIISTNVGDAMDQARQQFDAGIAGMSQSVKAWGDSLTMMGAQMGVLMAPLSDALSSAVDQALEFDASMVNVQSVLGSTREEIDLMSDQVLALGANSRQGAQAAAKAMYDIAGGVNDASSHMAVLETALDVATAGSADLDGVVNALIKTMNIYSLGAEDAAHAGDVFAQMVNKGVGTANEFAAALPPVEGLGKELGLTFDQLGGYMAYMSSKSESVAAGGTQLRGVFAKLMNPSKELGDAIAAMGYESSKAMVDQLGLVGALNKIKEFGGGSFSGLITDQEAMLGAIALTTEGASEFFETYNAGIDGATERAKAIQMASPAAQIDLLKNSLMGLSIQIGRELIPILGDIAKTIQPIVKSFTEWIATHGDLVRVVGGLIAGLSALSAGLIGMGLALSVGGTALAMMGGGLSVVLSPIALVGGAVVGLGIIFQEQLSGIVRFVRFFVNDLQSMNVFDSIRSALGWGENNESYLEPLLMSFGMTREAAQETVNSLHAAFMRLYGDFLTLQRIAINVFNYLGSARLGGMDIFQTLQLQINTTLPMLLDFLGITGQAADEIQAWLWQAVQTVKDLLGDVSTLISDIGEAFSTVLQGIDAFITGFQAFRNEGLGVFDALRGEINFFMGVVMRLAGVGGETSEAIQAWLIAAVTNIERLWNAAGTVFSSIWDWLSTLFSQIDTLDLSGVMEIIGPLYEVGSWLLALTNPLSLAWKVLTALGVDFVALIEDVASAISVFFDTLSQGGTLGDALSAVFGEDTITGITDGVNGVIDVVQQLQDLLVGLWEYVSPALTQFGDWFLYDVIPAINNLIWTALLPALQSIGDYLGQFWELVAPHLAAFADWFLYTALPAIEQFISDTVIPAIRDFIQVLTRLWNDVSPFLLELANWFLNDVLPSILDFINGVAIPAFETVIGVLAGLWEIVGPALETFYNWFITNGLPWILEQLELGRQAFQKLIDIVSGIWSEVSGGVGEFKDNLGAMVTWVDTNIVQPIITLIDKIINGFKGIGGAIQPYITEFQRIVTSVLDAITDAINGVLEALGLAQQQKEKLVVTTTTNANGDVIEDHAPADGNGSGFSVNKSKFGSLKDSLKPPPIVIGGGGAGFGSGIPRFATGADFIKKGGLAYLDDGEAVLTKEQNADRFNGGGPRIEIHIGQIIASGEAEGRAAGESLTQTVEERIRFSGGTFGD